jgi:hypothetical protein
LHLANIAFQEYLDTGGATLGFEHAQDVVRRMIAEELPPRLLVVRNTMFFDQGNEIRRRIPGQRGFCEVRVRGDEVFRRAIKIGEITAPAAGDENLLAGAIRAFQKRDPAPTFAGFDCAHEPGSSGAKNYSITMMK